MLRPFNYLSLKRNRSTNTNNNEPKTKKVLTDKPDVKSSKIKYGLSSFSKRVTGAFTIDKFFCATEDYHQKASNLRRKATYESDGCLDYRRNQHKKKESQQLTEYSHYTLPFIQPRKLRSILIKRKDSLEHDDLLVSTDQIQKSTESFARPDIILATNQSRNLPINNEPILPHTLRDEPSEIMHNTADQLQIWQDEFWIDPLFEEQYELEQKQLHQKQQLQKFQLEQLQHLQKKQLEYQHQVQQDYYQRWNQSNSATPTCSIKSVSQNSNVEDYASNASTYTDYERTDEKPNALSDDLPIYRLFRKSECRNYTIRKGRFEISVQGS